MDVCMYSLYMCSSDFILWRSVIVTWLGITIHYHTIPYNEGCLLSDSVVLERTIIVFCLVYFFFFVQVQL